MPEAVVFIAFLEDSPGSELQDIAIAIGEENSKVSVHLSQLKKQRKVNNQLGRWALASPREDLTDLKGVP